jgi:hypothetical protein
MANLSIQDFSSVGIAPAFTAAAAGGDTFSNAGQTFFFVKNSGASSINVTVNSVTPCNQGYDHDLVVAVAAGATQKIGPFDYGRFNDASNMVGVTYSGVSSVTVAALRL